MSGLLRYRAEKISIMSSQKRRTVLDDKPKWQLIEQRHAGKIARRNVFDLDREIDEIADFGYIAGGGFLNEQRPRCRNRPVHPNQV